MGTVCMQVHLAQIKGEKVVVKVQRPGLKALFDIDLKNVCPSTCLRGPGCVISLSVLAD